MSLSKYIFLFSSLVVLAGCEKEPTYLREDIQEKYLNDLKVKNIKTYKKDSIFCSIKMLDKEFLQVSFRNNSEYPIPLNKSILLINILNNKKNTLIWNPFRVVYQGEPVRYIGKVVSSSSLTIKDFIILPPKETYTAKINLGEYYDLSKPGVYIVKYKGPNYGLFDVFGIESLLIIESNTIEIVK